MDTFGHAPLPGGQVRVYPKNDMATYFDVLNAAVDLSSQCVEEKPNPQAGWSVTGKSVHESLSVVPSAFRIGFWSLPETY